MVARGGTERDNQAFLYISRIDAKLAFGIRFLKERCRSHPYLLATTVPRDLYIDWLRVSAILYGDVVDIDVEGNRSLDLVMFVLLRVD